MRAITAVKDLPTENGQDPEHGPEHPLAPAERRNTAFLRPAPEEQLLIMVVTAICLKRQILCE